MIKEGYLTNPMLLQRACSPKQSIKSCLSLTNRIKMSSNTALFRLYANIKEKNKKPKKIKIKSEGKHYNLREICDTLNSEYFNNRISSSITWGEKSPLSAVKKRTLGSYQKNTNTIRINPVLDNKRIPRYFIEYIVYHEMLHAEIDVQYKNGRRKIHSKDFKKRESIFKYYDIARQWEKHNF